MTEDILFEEIQGSSKTASRKLTVAAACFFLISLVIQWLHHRLNEPISSALFLGLIICATVIIFLESKLITQVRIDGIYVKYPPFQPVFKVFPWDQIEEVYIRDYEPVSEYGGWGVKTGPGGSAFAAGGTTGLQLVLKDGRRLLIGTRKGIEIIGVIQQLRP